MHEKEFTFQIFEISHIFTHPAFHEEVTNIHYTFRLPVLTWIFKCV